VAELTVVAARRQPLEGAVVWKGVLRQRQRRAANGECAGSACRDRQAGAGQWGGRARWGIGEGGGRSLTDGPSRCRTVRVIMAWVRSAGPAR
jgi:hypothetical protein